MYRTLSILLLFVAAVVQAADLPFSSFPRTNVVHPEDWLIIQTTNYHSPSGQSTRLLKVSDFLSGLGVVSNAAIVNIINVFTTNQYITTVSNSVALSVSNVATFGIGGTVILGTNNAGGDGADIVLDPFNIRNGADFLASHQSRGPVFTSNGVWKGMIDMQYNHPGPGGANLEMGVICDGDIHIKPALGSPNGYSIIGLGGNAKDGIVSLNQTPASGNSQMLTWNAGFAGNPVGIIAHTNTDGVSDYLDIYNPAPTWSGTAWTGGNLQARIGTNYFHLSSSLVRLGGDPVVGNQAVQWNASVGFWYFGVNGVEVNLIHGPGGGGTPYWRAGSLTEHGEKFEIYGNLWLGGTVLATNGYWFTNQVAPTAGQVGGIVGSRTNHLLKNVGSALIDYWSDGTTLYSKQLAP